MTQNISVKDKETIIDFLRYGTTTTSDNAQLLDNLGLKSSRHLKRKLETLFDDGVLHRTTQGKQHVYTLMNKETLAVNLASKNPRIFNYLLDLPVKDFDETSVPLLKKIFAAMSNNVIGHLGIVEDLQNERFHKMYEIFESAIKNRYSMQLHLNDEGFLDEVKPIRIVFIDNNWNLAFETKDPDNGKKVFRFCRFSFIDKWDFITTDKKRNTFHVKDMHAYEIFLDTAQNGLSLYDVPIQTATIRATPAVAKYFDDGMKKFLRSQTFISQEADGSVIFTLEYTQPLEIFILIRRWLPELIILQPRSLAEAYCADLRETLARHDTICHDEAL
jgi:hypothetical protein